MKDAHPEIEEISAFFYPMAEVQISEGSTFAVVSRLASCEFPVSKKRRTQIPPEFPVSKKRRTQIPPDLPKVNVVILKEQFLCTKK